MDQGFSHRLLCVYAVICNPSTIDLHFVSVTTFSIVEMLIAEFCDA